MLQPLSAPLLGGVSFFRRSVARHPASLPCGRLSSEEEGWWVYHVSFKQRLDDLAPAYYTGSPIVRVPAY